MFVLSFTLFVKGLYRFIAFRMRFARIRYTVVCLGDIVEFSRVNVFRFFLASFSLSGAYCVPHFNVILYFKVNWDLVCRFLYFNGIEVCSIDGAFDLFCILFLNRDGTYSG